LCPTCSDEKRTLEPGQCPQPSCSDMQSAKKGYKLRLSIVMLY